MLCGGMDPTAGPNSTEEIWSWGWGQTKVMITRYSWHYASLASETLCPQAHVALCQAQWKTENADHRGDQPRGPLQPMPSLF